MDKLEGLKHEELKQLLRDVIERLKEFRPIRIKMKWKRCGRKTCFCKDGPADGSWNNLHGPYVFAQFVSNETRKTQVVSLGRHYDDIDIDEVAELFLDKSSIFQIGDGPYQKLSKKKKEALLYSVTLADREFKEKYGILPEDDRMNRERKFWGSKAQWDEWEYQNGIIEEQKMACKHPWAVDHGVGSPVGQKILAELLRQNYYLVSS